ncbi:MAG: phosphatase PAP2 family protein [Clostridia bacterium]|nr:phosphatase PAP2 family protein [Clostridia bacterium]
MKYDYVAIYEKNAERLKGKEKLLRFIRLFNKLATALFFVAYAVFVGVAVFKDYPAKQLIGILGAPALCLFLVTVLRYAINRPRPYSEQGAGITPLHEKKALDKSFPSRHVASAFVIATTLLPYAVWAGAPLLAIGFALAYIRFALGLHYPTDLVGGAVLGILCGAVNFFL